MTLHFAAVNADGVVADLDMGPAAYRILLKLRAYSEPGGRLVQNQDEIAKLVKISRATVITGMRDLELAHLVKRVKNGTYQLNAMIAPYRSPEDCVAAISVMPAEHRLDHPDFVGAYQRAAAAYKDQLAEQRKKRAKAKTRKAGNIRVLPAVG
ncbi:replication/maintenance protein RepL [Kitasatospora sp. NPDC048545]|uniref:replication/maintenance protein RepL n=1 Tax=Kitasatospora sp. NPDC048545 TaxID=3157208 RepID=UPI003405CD01